jgi:hypothetical protein
VLACQTRAMNDQEIESGAIREIEPEVRTLFTKLVEYDPQEAANMLEPYPDEFVVQMLDLLNPASALKILQRFLPSRRQTTTDTPDQGNVAWNIKRSLDRRNRRNRDVYLCNDGEKPVGFDAKFCGIPCYHHQLLP